jgi:hypothetical protein
VRRNGPGWMKIDEEGAARARALIRPLASCPFLNLDLLAQAVQEGQPSAGRGLFEGVVTDGWVELLLLSLHYFG